MAQLMRSLETSGRLVDAFYNRHFIPSFVSHPHSFSSILHHRGVTLRSNRLLSHTPKYNNMGRGGRGRGRSGGRGGGRGYDWRKHVRPSADPVVQNEVRQIVQQFLASKSNQKEVQCEGSEMKNTYKQYCKQMGVGWVKGSRRGWFKLVRFTSADPEMTLWKKVWCFYYQQYCDVDLIEEAKISIEADGNIDVKLPSSDGDMAGVDVDAEEAALILRLQQQIEADDSDAEDESETDIGSSNKVVLDTTSSSFDGKRMWTKVRDLLLEIKHDDNQLWEECCSLGVNNCSERKLEPHMDKVEKFFDLQGRGPNQKIRGKKLQVEIGSDESVHFLDGSDKDVVIEYAKPVKYCDTHAIRELIKKVDKANQSLGAKINSGNVGEENAPSNIFNNNWRKRRRNFELGERLVGDNMDPIYHERKNNLRKRLPAFGVGDEFCKRVFENDVVVLCGATGSGKTTQLPQLLMEAAAKLMHSESMQDGTRQFGTGRIICTQPRRISATSVTERVCYERHEKVGDRVGYQIRFEQRATDSTELLYCTTGILLRFLVGNPKLEGISCVILDEVHERSTQSDLVLLILRDLVLERKGFSEPLKIVLMSATIDASNFIKYFDPDSDIQFNNMSNAIRNKSEAPSTTTGKSSPSSFSVSFLEIEGKTNYPIDEYFIEDIYNEIPSLVVSGPPPMSNCGGWNNGPQEIRNPWATAEGVRSKYHELGLRVKSNNRGVWQTLSNVLQRPFQLDEELICKVVEHIEQSESTAPKTNGDKDDALGAILIFVPGWAEITSVVKALEDTLKDCRRQCEWARNSKRSWNILPLHSMVPPKDQNRVFDSEAPHSGRRKIIVSTSIAETSITIEEVVYVIDPGLTKGTTYSAHTNIAALETMQISRSNVQQRRGRSGRCKPGQFFKLYSHYEFVHEMRDHELPEMLRTPVEELCLQVKSLSLGDLPVKNILQKAVSPPEPLALENAVQLLTELGAFESSEERMTPLGWQLCQLPVHPVLGKMLLLGHLFARFSSNPNSQNIIHPLTSICSTLSFKSPFILPFGKEKEADRARKNYGQGLLSDHLLFAKVADDYACKRGNRSRGEFTGWLDKNFLSKKTLEQTGKIQYDLDRHLKDLKMNDASIGRTTETHAPKSLLLAILAASLSLSFTSPRSKKLCSLHGGSDCSVHPSSLLSMIEAAGNERMLWRQYKHLLRSRSNDPIVEAFVLDSPDKILILGWFERLKTREVYLRDATLFSDPLPLLLLLPGITQRGVGGKKHNSASFSDDPTIFEVLGGKASQGGDAHNQGDNNESKHPTLLLKVKDESTAKLLSSLRTKLSSFFAAVLSKGMHSGMSDAIETDTRAVFHDLEAVIEKSHSLYMADGMLSGSAQSTTMLDSDIMEVRHLHTASHCTILNSSEADNCDIDIDMDQDEEDGYSNRDRDNATWRGNSWGPREGNDWRGGHGRGWGGKRGRGGRGRGRGDAKRGRSGRWS